MLHIVNGDAVANKLEQAGVQGDVLVWREVYSMGPVFRDMAGYGNRIARAQFLERAVGIPESEYLRVCAVQENALESFRKYTDIVLWFEHDLFDQTMLCYLLHRFAERSLDGVRLNLLCIGSYPGIDLFRGLGQLSPTQLASLFGSWHAVGRQELELGCHMWNAYTSPDLKDHHDFLQRDLTALPFVRSAFEAHLSRLPAGNDGLGVIERTTLKRVADGLSDPHELFKQVGDELHVLGMGDLEYWYYLARMVEGPHALLQRQGVADYPGYIQSVPLFRNNSFTLTELGRKVLEGDRIWEAASGSDVWFGGMRLKKIT